MSATVKSSPEALTVLIADDDSLVLRAIGITLLDIGYHVLQGRDGREARALLEQHRGQPLHLLITDVDMPGCGGPELAKYAREQFSGVKILFTSGKPRHGLEGFPKLDANFQYLEKLFATKELMKSVQALLTN